MLYLIGNAHLDPVWLWRWQEGFSEILATFRSALDRMNEFPEMEFTSACAVYYEWVEKVDPEMFAEIQARVKEGRWHIVGGWFLQPDCNAPRGESFARHALISQRYFREKFGVTAATGYNVDSFGHNAMLPQILRRSGMKNYVFMRPSPAENPDLADLFRWESEDGSAVTAYRIQDRYCITTRSLDVMDRIRERAEDGTPRMAYVGVGNHGGGPTIELIEALRARGRDDEVWSSPDAYFEAVKGTPMPTVRGELQHHARGCYSANTFIKKGNRQCESNLLTAEALCLLASRLAGMKYPAEKLTKAWKDLLFCQFHDIMGGCSIAPAYKDAGYLYGEIMSITEQAIYRAMAVISRRIDNLRGNTMPSTKQPGVSRMWIHEALGSPFVVFNPHPWAIRSAVTLAPEIPRVEDKDGVLLPSQRIRGPQTNGTDKYATLVSVTVPPYGYTTLRAVMNSKAAPAPSAVSAGENFLENECLRVDFDSASGAIARVTDKRTGKAILAGVSKVILTDESECDTWAHNRFDLGPDAGTFGAPEFRVKESGPVRAVLSVTVHFGASSVTQEYSLCTNEDELRADVTTDFHEKHRALKLCFPCADTVTAANAFGSIDRPAGTGEEVCGMWLASGPLGIAGDSISAYDSKDGFLRCTILRGAIYADHYGARDGECTYMDMGEGHFTITLFPFTTRADAARRALALNEPLRVYADTFHGGALPEEHSCAVCGNENLVVTSLRQTDEGFAALRFFEADGDDADASLRFFEHELSVSVRAREIRTFREDGTELDFLDDPAG